MNLPSYMLSREILGGMSKSLEDSGYCWVSETTKHLDTVKNYKQCHYSGTFGLHGKNPGEFFDPHGICSSDKHLYVTDAIKNSLSIFRLDHIISSIGKDSETRTECAKPIKEHDFSSIFDVTVHKPTGSVFITDPVDECIRCVRTEEVNETNSLSLFSDTIALPGFKTLSGVSVTPDGFLCTLDSESGRVIICDDKGNIRHVFGCEGRSDGEFCFPQFLFWDEINNRLLVSDTANARVQALTIDGRFLFSFGTFGFNKDKSCFKYPSGILSDDHGRMFVVDQGLHNIQIFDRDGNWLHKLGGPGAGEGLFNSPKSMCFVQNGDILVTDSLNCSVQYFT